MRENVRRARDVLKNEGPVALTGEIKEYVTKKVCDREKIHLSYLEGREDLIVAEIGVWRGRNAEFLAKNLSIDKMYLIDPYNTYDEYDSKTDIKEMRSAREQAHRRMKDQCKVEWIEKYSNEAVTDINEKLDYVYIDGNHSYKYVKNDVEDYYPLLREGGIMAGDDMDWDGVSQAITEFAFKNDLQLHLEPYHPDWYFIEGHGTESHNPSVENEARL